MIEKWFLNNFKSVESETSLGFRPLTIFTGANSSGKSTILQSILLVTQTLQNQISSRSIVLNGAIKQLGSYGDVVSMRDASKRISIGFCVSRDKDGSESRIYSLDEDVHDVNCTFELSSQKLEDLQPRLESFKLITHEKDSEKEYTVDIQRHFRKHNDNLIIKAATEITETDREYDVQLNFTPRFRSFGGKPLETFIGAQFFHFLPFFLFGVYKRKELYKTYINELFEGRRFVYSLLKSSEEQALVSILQKTCNDIIDDIATHSSNKNKALVKKLKSSFTFDDFEQLIQKTKQSQEKKSHYIKQLLTVIDKTDDDFGIDRIPMYYEPGIDFIKNFFTENIKYLGPLRDEPKAIYPLDNAGSIVDVGLKGENTAAVFDLNKSVSVSYIDPGENASFDTDLIKTGPLSEAINKWLVYLGVANTINTSDKGKFGHELKIQTDGTEMQQDLTHVGVGVSQILPILVLCLLSKKGSVIILEQPELHLHPRVQTRLADFFVGLIVLGKQCIIETHSEYLINRLRFLVAKSKDNKVSEQTMIYFVEKEAGQSVYRPITINKYGVIEDWPKGFFDESEDIAADVLRAGLEKRKKELHFHMSKGKR